MRLRDVSVFLSALIIAAAVLLAQGVMAAGQGAITPEEGKAMVQQKKDLVILDVRNPNEYAVVHYPNALLIPVNELETRVSEVPADKPVLVHCGKGMRAQRGYEILKAKRPDIKELYYIQGDVIF
jgi:rhodanese-related sulfurtransferase